MKMIVASLCIALTLSFFSAQREFSKLCQFIDTMQLSSGKIQYFDYKDTRDVTYRVGALLVDASPETIWGILEDVEKLGKALNHIEYYRIRHDNEAGNRWRKGKKVVEGKFSIRDYPAQFTLSMEFNQTGKWRRWQLLSPQEVVSFNEKGIKVLPPSGLIKDMAGFEFVQPFEDGGKAVYYNAMNIKSTIPLPEFIHSAIFDAVYTRQMTLIKKMAESYAQEHDVEAHE